MRRKKKSAEDMKNRISKVINRYFLKKAQRELAKIPTLTDVEDRSRACNLRHTWNPATNLLICTINCGNINHIAEVEFINPDPTKKPLDSEVAIACDCGDFTFGGPIYNLNRSKNLRGPMRFPGRILVPRIRDPRLVKFLCKHLVTVKKFLRGKTFTDL